MKLAGKTDVGRVRQENQDDYRAGELPGGAVWALVCDGMGGAKGGREASQGACNVIEQVFQEQYAQCGAGQEGAFLKKALISANRYVFNKAAHEESLAGMGTTAVCALVRGGEATLCHAGDSRAYLCRGGKLTQLTHDHSYVQELVDCGTITVEEAEHHPQKNIITRALGVDYRLDSEFTTAPLQKGDILLLCSDGLTNAVPREQLEQLLRTVDPAVRFYAADHACFADSAAVETFLSDTAPGPKVLLCVNAPGVQQPLEGLAGVILVRQSSLMSTFKQMLCRALVAAGSRSVPVFDLVAQFEGLGNGRTLQRDCTEAMTRAGSKTPGFRQERPMQQTYRLYGKLRREMEARWEVLCQAAADAAAKEGTLELPRSYTIHSGLHVGKWLELQRQVQAGQRPGRLTAEQAAKLEKLGIRWNHRLEAAWEKGFASAQKYRTEHGDLLVPVRYRDKNDFALGEWIVYNRQRYLGGNLTQNRIERLEAIGMVWSTSNDLWEQNYAAATQYYLEHGDLEVPIKYETPSGFGLGVWLGAQRAAHKAGELPQEQVERLDALGMDWTNRNDRKWMSLYDVAAAYYHEHGNLNVPSEYIDPDGVLLGKWVSRQRYAWQNPDRSSARLTPERKALLDQLGMVWQKPDSWQHRYELAAAYKAAHGSLELP